MKLIRNGNEFIMKNGGETILEYSKDRPMIYAGRGKEDVDMYRGNYQIEDYVTTRRPLFATDARETQEGLILNLEDEITLTLKLSGDCAELFFEPKNPEINRFWLRVNADDNEKRYGCGLSHSDIGGYTSLFGNTRTKELFLRWAEMAAFTPVMRTHEGNRPDENFQYYDDTDCMKRLERMVDVYTMLAPYMKILVAENAERGIPVQRPLFLLYENDEKSYDIQYEYMLGPVRNTKKVSIRCRQHWATYLSSIRRIRSMLLYLQRFAENTGSK